jgi:hypothetical protein
MSIADIVRENLGPNEMQQIASQLGVDAPTASRAVDSALPGMLAGMAGHASSDTGAGSIEGLLGSHGGILGNLGSMLGGAQGGGGAGGMLGQIFGQHSDTVTQSVQQTSGLDSGKTKQLLMILAPIVLAAIAKHRSSGAAQSTQPAGNGGLGSVLQQEARTAAQNSPHAGGLLGKILSHVETPRQ